MLVAGALLGFDVVLDVDEQAGLPGALLRLAGGAGPSGDPSGQGLLSVVGAQGLQTGEPLLARSPGGDVLAPFQLVTFPLEAAEQVLQVGAAGQEPVDGGAQLCFKVMRLSDNSGEGMMTLYHVFPGVFLMYNDFHMKECISGFQSDGDLLCIDHCREGRIEQEVGQDAFSYLEAGDLRVDRRIHHSGKVEFPLCHYHGISIGFQMETAAKEIPAYMKGFSVDLYELQNKYCSDRTPYVIPGEPAIEHIFSELYNVPVKIKRDYFKIKVLELLLYLDALELTGHTEERPYFYKGQIEKIKAIQALLTQDLTQNYTLEELSERFDIALTPMKNCFKSVYGSPIFTYMRNYRMNYAASLLRSDKTLKVAEIAGLVGYDSPSKFASAFHQTMGKTPLEYRKSII